MGLSTVTGDLLSDVIVAMVVVVVVYTCRSLHTHAFSCIYHKYEGVWTHYMVLSIVLPYMRGTY